MDLLLNSCSIYIQSDTIYIFSDTRTSRGSIHNHFLRSHARDDDIGAIAQSVSDALKASTHIDQFPQDHDPKKYLKTFLSRVNEKKYSDFVRKTECVLVAKNKKQIQLTPTTRYRLSGFSHNKDEQVTLNIDKDIISLLTNALAPLLDQTKSQHEKNKNINTATKNKVAKRKTVKKLPQQQPPANMTSTSTNTPHQQPAEGEERMGPWAITIRKWRNRLESLFTKPNTTELEFTVGDRVTVTGLGGVGTVRRINRRANYGLGMITVLTDDGRTLNMSINAHAFKKLTTEQPQTMATPPVPSKLNSKPMTLDATPDAPVSFGYKMTWLAIQSDSAENIVDALALTIIAPANWETGVATAYEFSPHRVFVTPAVNNWVFVLGALPSSGSAQAEDSALTLIRNLGKQFPDVQYFRTHRVSEWHAWARVVSGELVRAYAYCGGKLWDTGAPTNEEKLLGFHFFDHDSKAAHEESYWERNDLEYPDESHVMRLAEQWSIDPTQLENMSLAKSFGYVGSFPH